MDIDDGVVSTLGKHVDQHRQRQRIVEYGVFGVDMRHAGDCVAKDDRDHLPFDEGDHPGEELARLQFDGGYTSYSTVLQAEQQLFPAELNQATIRAQLYASFVGIYQALGGGWVNKADDLSPQPMAGTLTPADEKASAPAQ